MNVVVLILLTFIYDISFGNLDRMFRQNLVTAMWVPQGRRVGLSQARLYKRRLLYRFGLISDIVYLCDEIFRWQYRVEVGVFLTFQSLLSSDKRLV